MERKRLNTGAIDWEFVDKGTGPPILFVHGFPLSSEMWKFQIDGLADQFRVIAPDLPGYGSTRRARPASETSMAQMALELVEFLDALGVEKTAFCGLSMGGYIGWQFWKSFPDRLTHMIACDTKSVSDTEEVARARRILAKGVQANGTRRVAEAMIPKLFASGTRQAQPEVVQQIAEIITETSPQTIAMGHLAMSVRSDFSGQLRNLEPRPTLIVVGEHDEISTPLEMKRICEQIPGSEYLQVAAAGHMAPLESPVPVNEAIGRLMNAN